MLCPHIIGGVGEGKHFLFRTGAKWVKFVHGFEASRPPSDPTEPDWPADTKMVGRYVYPGEFLPIDVFNRGEDPVQAAEYYYRSYLREHVIENPRIKYWETSNEPGMGTWNGDGIRVLDYMRTLAAFNRRMVELLAADNRRAVIGNFSVGVPDLPEHDRLHVWREFYPALKAAHEAGGYLGLHEYSNGLTEWDTWLQYRYRWALKYLDEAGLSGLRILITEFGADNLPGDGKPWRQMFDGDPTRYADFLSAYIARVQNDYPRVEAAFLFTFGAKDLWHEHNVDDVGFTDAWLARRPSSPEEKPPIVQPKPSDGATHVVSGAQMLNVRLFPWIGSELPPIMDRLPGGTRVKQYGTEFALGAYRWICISPSGNRWVRGDYLKRA